VTNIEPGDRFATGRAFPRSAEELTAEWLTLVLREASAVSADTAVREIGLEPIGAGSGMAGSLVRLVLTYDAGGTGGPPSVVAKFSASDDRRRSIMGALLGVYEREVRFYSTLADRVRMVTPICYYAAFQPETHHSVLLLEDLTGETMGADDESCSPEEGDMAMAAVARMHAAWWNSPELAPMSWLRREQVPEPEVTEMIRACYPKFRERFGAAVASELWPILDRLASGEAPIFSAASTLYHGDFSPKNVCFRKDATVVAFDWQLVGQGPPALDLLRFLMAAVQTPAGRQRVDDVLTTYQAALASEGVMGYARNALQRDCMAAAALTLQRALAIGGAPEEIDDLRTETVLRTLEQVALLLQGADPQELFE
jgi:hypothetical protein